MIFQSQKQYTYINTSPNCQALNKSRIKIKSLVIIVSIVAIIISVYAYIQQPVQLQYLKIQTESGNYVEVNYLKPDQFRVQQKVADVIPKDLGFINVPQVQQYLSKTKDDKLKMALGFVFDQNRTLVDQAEYYYYNKTYNLDQTIQQIPFCILSPFKNFFGRSEVGMNYLKSVERLNYSNFQVWMADDLSTDNSAFRILKLVKTQFPRFANRMRILKTKTYTELLGNHDILTRNYCKKQSIVLQLDGDDQLVGRQSLKLLNIVYQTKDEQGNKPWFVYSDFMWNYGGQYVKFGNRPIPDQVYETNSYRAWDDWVTSHLKTYSRQLYMKIPYQHFMRIPGNYYLFSADRYLIYPVAQLAGKNHTKFIDQLLYYYSSSSGEGLCYHHQLHMSEGVARLKTPFMPLKNLQEPTQQVPNYVEPKKIRDDWLLETSTNYHCLTNYIRKKIKEPAYIFGIQNRY